MATWQDIGVENFRSALSLYDVGGEAYRSCLSRFYYSVFSVVTYELRRRNATADFHQNRQTPGHLQVAALIDQYFTQMSEPQRRNLIRRVNDSYRLRIAADYIVDPVDKRAAQDAHRAAEAVFRYLGVNHERKRRS